MRLGEYVCMSRLPSVHQEVNKGMLICSEDPRLACSIFGDDSGTGIKVDGGPHEERC
jgi:hypothetical protein